MVQVHEHGEAPRALFDRVLARKHAKNVPIDVTVIVFTYTIQVTRCDTSILSVLIHSSTRQGTNELSNATHIAGMPGRAELTKVSLEYHNRTRNADLGDV